MSKLAKSLMMGAAGASGEVLGVEDVFSTYLYTGNGSTQTITNGIDLAGEGGLVWIKERNDGSNHHLVDSERGKFSIYSNSTSQAYDLSSTGPFGPPNGTVAALNSDGFYLDGPGYTVNEINVSNNTYVSWTFRKAEKFFDVVTYTGDGNAGRSISHSLGSEPGFIITKRTDGTTNWLCYHRSLGFGNAANADTNYIVLNSTSQSNGFGTAGVIVSANSSSFTPGASANFNGATYVAYLFAHDAGGFGAGSAESVIKCGSVSDPGTGVTVDLGWEPQWVLLKRTSSTGGNWRVIDNMRGWSMYAQASRQLFPNTSGAEDASEAWGNPTATGFFLNAAATGDYIYIAIRRGPMKTPESGTEVYNAITYTGDGAASRTLTTTILPDLLIQMNRGGNDHDTIDRLRGPQRTLYTNLTYSDTFNTNYNKMLSSLTNNGFVTGTDGSNYWNGNTNSLGAWAFRRAPGFFDVVAYTGNGVSGRTVSHNLGVVPELMIAKRRDASGTWNTYSVTVGATAFLQINSDSVPTTASNIWNDTAPTSSVFSIGNHASINASGSPFIAYLFATCPGVSKVGSYTGTGTTLDVDCGFTAGARFVLIKRTDSTGDWYVWDTARGIVSGNDPYLLLNSTAAEVTNTDYIDPMNSGFQISSTAPDAINASEGSFIFLAIA